MTGDDCRRPAAGRKRGPGDETTSRGRVIGPIAAGVILDLIDFATYGPIGLWTGLVAGGVAGYLLAAGLGVARERRFGYALVAGAYCTLPFTAFLPCATLLGALIRWREKGPEEVEAARPGRDAPAIEAEYDSEWDSR